MKRTIPLILLSIAPIAAQSLVVDRKPVAAAKLQPIELPSGGFLSDFFRIGNAGEVWMIDSLRLWFAPAQGPACGKELGDSIEKITLLAALDNPPVPGQPVCDCHALVSLATVPLDRGTSVSRNADAKLSKEGDLWRVDFQNVRWSIPAAGDALFTLRATPRGKSACKADRGWSLAGAEAPAGHKLHLLNEKGVPVGLTEKESPHSLAIQVWAHQWK